MKRGDRSAKPGDDHDQSLITSSSLGASVGSLYAAALVMWSIEEAFSLRTLLLCFAATALVSLPVLVAISMLVAPWLVAWLIRYQRQRTMVFAFAGGMVGLAIFAIASVIFELFGPLGLGHGMKRAVTYFLLSTIPFCYGAATGAFIAFDLGPPKNAETDSSTKID